MRGIMMALAAVAVAVLMFAPSSAVASSTPEVDALMARALSAYSAVNDYSCLFDRKELVGGRLQTDHGIYFKFRSEPFSVYMRWTEGDDEGVEAIFVNGANANEMRVHLGGAMSFIDVSIDPEGSLAMRNNRHSIKEAGIGFILGLVNDNYQRARLDSQSDIRVMDRPVHETAQTVAVEATLPAGKGYYAHRVRVLFDVDSGLPLGIAAWDWGGNLIEEYRFRALIMNVGHTDSAFDPGNPEYGF